MYVAPATFSGVCAFIDGFNLARDHGPLQGFREWMVVRLRTGDNFHWPRLVEMALNHPADGLSTQENIDAIARFGVLMEEFFAHRERNGTAAIYHDYARWLSKQTWYNRPLKKSKRKSA
jgi:hypothetical protein